MRDLFSRYFGDIRSLPPEWSEDIANGDTPLKARRIADFIAGMTDNFAIKEHHRFFDSKLDLR